jgi:hypothetical protein
MRVLREHLESGDRRWPVNRGLDLLEQLILESSRNCCVMCACKEWRTCHRTAVADALAKRWTGGLLAITHL